VFRRFPGRVCHPGGHWLACSVSSSRPSIRACGSPAHGSPTFFTGGVRLDPPGLVGPGCDDDAIEGDQAEIVGRSVELIEAPSPAALVPLGHEQGQPHQRILSDLAEGVGGAVKEVVWDINLFLRGWAAYFRYGMPADICDAAVDVESLDIVSRSLTGPCRNSSSAPTIRTAAALGRVRRARCGQPGPHGHEPDAVSGVLHRLA
jgi:hypothetical protein